MSAGESESILARTARGASWVIAWRMMTRLLGLASTLILVRLLPPGDFGLVALATAFALALDVCLAIGVEDQIVRARDPHPALYDTAFTLNLLRSCIVGALIAIAAGPAAGFFSEPRLEPVLLALAVSAVLSGATNVGVADFRRRLMFNKEFQLQFVPRVAGIVVTVAGAWVLRSHWALVLGILTNRLGIVAMSHLLHPYRPRLSLSAWRDLAGVSCWAWAISIVTLVRDRADSMVIGRLLGPTPLGIYAVGVEVAVLPTTEMVDPICRACMPSFTASLRGGGVELGASYLRIIALAALLTLPAGVGVSLVAGPVVALAFGPAWLEAAPLVTILGIACTLTLFGNVSAALLSAKTMLRSIFGVTAASAALRVVLLLALTPAYGLLGAGIAGGIAVVAEHAVLVACALRLLQLPFRRFLGCIQRPVLATATMAALLWSSGLGWTAPPDAAATAAHMLLVSIPLGVVSFTAMLATVWFIAGCPAGAEADMIALLRRMSGRVSRQRFSTVGQG